MLDDNQPNTARAAAFLAKHYEINEASLADRTD